MLTQVDARAVQTRVDISFPLATTFDSGRAALLVMTEMIDLEVGRVRSDLGASYGMNAQLDDHRPRVSDARCAR